MNLKMRKQNDSDRKQFDKSPDGDHDQTDESDKEPPDDVVVTNDLQDVRLPWQPGTDQT